MRKRLIQVFGFLIATFGWLFVSCTLAMDYWRVFYVGGKGGNWMIKATWYWSNLWKDCVMDTSSVTNCRDYDVLWAVTPYVQGVRGLLLIAMSLGLVAAVLCFIGMDCTYIGGSQKNKDRILLFGAAFHCVGGVSALAAYCLYTNRVVSAAFSPTVDRSIIRTVMMYTEIGCFVACVCGWILVCSTMPTNYWTYSEVDSLVLTSGHYFSNLWKDCLSDSTGVTDCKEFPTLLALQTYIHLCRSLVIVSIILGFFGSILALVGMKCTKLGGSEIVNARVTFAAGMNYLFSGLCGMFAYSCYAHKVISEFMDPNYKAKKFELGSALFVGWGGSALLAAGGFVYSITAGKEGCRSSSKTQETSYHTPSSNLSEANQKTYSPPLSPIPDRANQKTSKPPKGSHAYV
ncbi:claudin-10-like [Sinocyclocheilus grahami]|uniref:claudin-10-like n=1 Tax=Sinocyclocheilus grahami TaxID=75366 RepID=UPI0007ACAD38|nr:PREDICTED: claudin-10-like [Sinocyclocheilus grahami]